MTAERHRKLPQALPQERVRKLGSALTGALRAGDRQADELARLSQLTARQRNVMWRAVNLIRQGRYIAAVLIMENDLLSRERKEPAQ